MKLIDDWKQVWKWYSTHAMVIYMALVSYYVSLEPTVKEQIPNWMHRYCDCRHYIHHRPYRKAGRNQ